MLINCFSFAFSRSFTGRHLCSFPKSWTHLAWRWLNLVDPCPAIPSLWDHLDVWEGGQQNLALPYWTSIWHLGQHRERSWPLCLPTWSQSQKALDVAGASFMRITCCRNCENARHWSQNRIRQSKLMLFAPWRNFQQKYWLWIGWRFVWFVWTFRFRRKLISAQRCCSN